MKDIFVIVQKFNTWTHSSKIITWPTWILLHFTNLEIGTYVNRAD